MARGSQLGFEDQKNSLGSQRSMFPWDNAGASSSAGGHFFSDRVGFAQADIRLRSGSLSQRGSPLPHGSQCGSVIGGVSGLSYAEQQRSQGLGGDFAVDCKSVG
jgi:hypothetical protein